MFDCVVLTHVCKSVQAAEPTELWVMLLQAADPVHDPVRPWKLARPWQALVAEHALSMTVVFSHWTQLIPPLQESRPTCDVSQNLHDKLPAQEDVPTSESSRRSWQLRGPWHALSSIVLLLDRSQQLSCPMHAPARSWECNNVLQLLAPVQVWL